MPVVVRRLMSVVPALLVLSLVLFSLLELAPGDVTLVLLSDTATDEQRAQVESELGLGGSMLARYVRYLAGLVRLDFGVSARSGLPVAQEILKRLPPTLALLGTSLSLGALIGTGLGFIAARTRDTWTDSLISAGISLLTAAPVFWIALILVSLVSVRLGWLPVLGSGTPAHLVLPAFCASLALVPGVTRLTRSGLIESMSSSYVNAARSRGVGGVSMLVRHVGPSAALSVLSYLGIQSVRLVTSLAVMETIFGRPGLGSMIIRSAFDRDGTVLVGSSLVIAFLTFLVFFVIDAISMLIDPRLRS